MRNAFKHPLAAFEQSTEPDDWRELMRLYLVRRTRTFIKENYAHTDSLTHRKYLLRSGGTKDYFPDRIPKTVKFEMNDDAAEDQYARLYSNHVVNIIDNLALPRYGLGNYIDPDPRVPANQMESQLLENLSRAGERLKGFTRTNLFKRLESSGSSFLQSIERHILRNYVYSHAIENGLELPIGAQDIAILETGSLDEDAEAVGSVQGFFGDEDDADTVLPNSVHAWDEASLQQRAGEVYANYASAFHSRFKWIRSDLFEQQLVLRLKQDAQELIKILNSAGRWEPGTDTKLNELDKLLTITHPDQKVLIFSQFADTVRYLEAQLKERGLERIVGVTGNSNDPTSLAWRFSPESNGKRDS